MVRESTAHPSRAVRGHPSSESQEEGDSPALSKCPTRVLFLFSFLPLPPSDLLSFSFLAYSRCSLQGLSALQGHAPPGGHTSPFPERRMVAATSSHQENPVPGQRWPNSPSESGCKAIPLLTGPPPPSTSKHTILLCDHLHIFILSLFPSFLEVPRICFIERVEFLSVKLSLRESGEVPYFYREGRTLEDPRRCGTEAGSNPAQQTPTESALLSSLCIAGFPSPGGNTEIFKPLLLISVIINLFNVYELFRKCFTIIIYPTPSAQTLS